MSDFNAKMHKNRFPLELCPRPLWGSLQLSPNLCLYLRPILLRARREREGKGRVP